MKTIDLAQRTPEWHQWRAQGITASESAIILGRSPYKTPWRLWAERTGLAKTEVLSKNPWSNAAIDSKMPLGNGSSSATTPWSCPSVVNPRKNRYCARPSMD
jgi:hypothetical protein